MEGGVLTGFATTLFKFTSMKSTTADVCKVFSYYCKIKKNNLFLPNL